MEGRSFGDVPLNIELKLEVATRPTRPASSSTPFAAPSSALDHGISGALEWPSAYFMKSPPVQHHDDACRDGVEKFISKYGRITTKSRPARKAAEA